MTDYQGKKTQEKFDKGMDMFLRHEECKKNGHRWNLSGFYKHNPHLWCSCCYIYLETKEIKKRGLTEIFINLLNTDNQEGFYITEGTYEYLMEN